VAADSSQLHQVVVNLCTNAVQAMGERPGLLELRLAPFMVDATCARSIPGLHEGPHVRLTISDNGCGMDQATLERIFEPFFTTKTVGKGTGLGLSVVHTIVKNHGGAITVYSHPGQGSTFHLYFPAAQASAPATTTAVSSSIARGQGERVLYVDDEEQLVLLARRKLEQLGYQVTGCTEPAEALEIFLARPADFDLVITDLTMPRMTGLVFGAEIRRIRREIPIILTSGFLRREDIEAAERLGIHDFIPKPSDPETFSRTLRTALSRDGRATRF
jgi:CheY-like chemotaxis protein